MLYVYTANNALWNEVDEMMDWCEVSFGEQRWRYVSGYKLGPL